MIEIILVILVAIGIGVFVKYPKIFFGVETINFGGYNVSDEYGDKAEAAKMMKLISSKIKQFINCLKSKYIYGSIEPIDGQMNIPETLIQRPRDDDMAPRNCVERLIRNWKQENFYEGTPNGKDSSFTIGKGDLFVICLRNKEGKIHELTTLLFVVLHEITHIININYGHENDFWDLFRWVLTEAEKCFDMKFPDYDSNPIVYCNTSISSNPLNNKGKHVKGHCPSGKCS